MKIDSPEDIELQCIKASLDNLMPNQVVLALTPLLDLLKEDTEKQKEIYKNILTFFQQEQTTRDKDFSLQLQDTERKLDHLKEEYMELIKHFQKAAPSEIYQRYPALSLPAVTHF